MLNVFGWIIWSLLLSVCVFWSYGCRKYSQSAHGVMWQTITSTLFFWIILIVFLIFDWNKLHILWLAPLVWLLSQFVILAGIPIITPLIMMILQIFMNLLLIGSGSRINYVQRESINQKDNFSNNNYNKSIEERIDELFNEINEIKKNVAIMESEAINFGLLNGYSQEIFKSITENINSYINLSIESDGLYNANKNRLFSEFVEINIWILNNIFSEDKEKIFIDKIIEDYCRFLNYSDNDNAIYNIEIYKKFNHYNNLWDKDKGGRQYKIASEVLANIYCRSIDDTSIYHDVLLYILTRIKYYYNLKNNIFHTKSENK